MYDVRPHRPLVRADESHIDRAHRFIEGTMRVYLTLYAALVLALWLCSPLVASELQNLYGYACVAVHVLAPIALARRAMRQGKETILSATEARNRARANRQVPHVGT